MKRRDVDLESLFERDADSRLLERRRREELGREPHAVPQSITPASFGAESIVDDGVEAAPRPAFLELTLAAHPEDGLIPGAVVTCVATVADPGDADVPDVRLRLVIPPEAEPIPGSFARDGVAIDGEALLADGLRLGTVASGAEVRIRFALRVLPGTEPLHVGAHATATGVPAIAAPALRLGRRAGHAAYDAPKPFYELETGEPDVEGAAIAPAAPEPAAPEPVAPEPPVAARPLAPAPPLVVPPPPAPVALTAPLRVEDARALERVFAGGVPHGLAAIALLAATACTGGPLGEALGLESFRAAVTAALPRALVAARMRKPTPPVVTREALAALRADAVAIAAPPARSGAPLLTLPLDPREEEALRAVLARDLADAFLRGVQVLLAIAPRALEGGPDGVAPDVAAALAAHRTAAGAWLMRVTVRRAVDRRFDPLTADDAALYEAGRRVVASLRAAVA